MDDKLDNEKKIQFDVCAAGELIMSQHRFIVLLLVCAGICVVNCNATETESVAGCPDMCVCRRINDNASSLDVKCGGQPQAKLTAIKEINFEPIKFDVVQL